MGREDMMLLMQDSSNNRKLNNSANKYEESDQITSESDIIHQQQSDSMSQSLQSVRQNQTNERQENHIRASNLQDVEKLIPMKHESSHV